MKNDMTMDVVPAAPAGVAEIGEEILAGMSGGESWWQTLLGKVFGGSSNTNTNTNTQTVNVGSNNGKQTPDGGAPDKPAKPITKPTK
jgi:hypothetical protein